MAAGYMNVAYEIRRVKFARVNEVRKIPNPTNLADCWRTTLTPGRHASSAKHSSNAVAFQDRSGFAIMSKNCVDILWKGEGRYSGPGCLDRFLFGF